MWIEKAALKANVIKLRWRTQEDFVSKRYGVFFSMFWPKIVCVLLCYVKFKGMTNKPSAAVCKLYYEKDKIYAILYMKLTAIPGLVLRLKLRSFRIGTTDVDINLCA